MSSAEAIGLVIRLAFGLAGAVLWWTTRRASNDGPRLPLFYQFVGSTWLFLLGVDAFAGILVNGSSLDWLAYSHRTYVVILGAGVPVASVLVAWLKPSFAEPTFLKLDPPRRGPDEKK